MNVEVKQMWLADLRSEKYEQGIGYLQKDNKYCCLGVLCDRYCKEKGKQWRDSIATENHPGAKGVGSSLVYLPKEVREWAGLEYGDPLTKEMGNYTLSYLNDTRKYTFLQIAAVIERDL